MSPLESERLILRPLQLKDAAAIIRLRALPEVSRFQGWCPGSEDDIKSLIASMQETGFLAPGQWFQVSIFLKETGQLIGDCGVHADAGQPKQVELGITLDPAFQKRGYARECLRVLLDHLFEKCGILRAHVSIDPENHASMRLFESVGFNKEAHRKQSLWFKDAWVDEVILALEKTAWKDRQ